MSSVQNLNIHSVEKNNLIKKEVIEGRLFISRFKSNTENNCAKIPSNINIFPNAQNS